MKRWEDIAKDKLEGYESRLPEGSLAEFRALRDGAGAARPQHRYAAVWALAGVVALLAAVLLLRLPGEPEEGVRIVQKPPVTAPAGQDSSAFAEPVPAQPLIAQAVTPQAAAALPQKAAPAAAQPAQNVSAECVNDSEPAENVSSETSEPETETAVNAPATALAELPELSPFAAETSASNSVRMKVGPAAAAVSGCSLLTAAAVALFGPQAGLPDQYGQVHYGKFLPRSVDACFPLRLGLSARFPLAGRLNLTTGLDYSLYAIKLESAVCTETLRAHYLGVPVRLDWTLAANKWLEIYVGGGLEGDINLATTLDGKSIHKDGFSFSLLGACGFQFNLSKRLGLFVEPQLSWTVPSKGHVLPTYRSQNPWTFTVNSGIRITFSKQ